MNATAIDRKANRKGIMFALVSYIDGTFGVYKRCENYSGKVRGGIEYTWRYVQRGMDRDAAQAMFNRRTSI